jgi:hypothetical protein
MYGRQYGRLAEEGMKIKGLLTTFAIVLVTSAVAAPIVYAICRSQWQQGLYYTGCGSTLQYAGEYLHACKPIDDYQNDTQDGDWLERYDGYCDWAYGNCLEDSPFSVTYWQKCNGTWVAKSESDFYNGNCSCP